MRFGFLLRRQQPLARQTAQSLIKLLRGRGLVTVSLAATLADDEAPLEDCEVVDAADFGKSIDVLVVLGGDGTLLVGAALVAGDAVPVLGINLGGLGFMTQYGVEQAEDAVVAAAECRLQIEERMRLRVTVVDNGGVTLERFAVNEAVVNHRLMARLLDLKAEYDGHHISDFKVDGLIVASPTGSTAYSLAAGGPVLTPGIQAMVLTPICSHTLTNRPVVLQADKMLRLTNTSDHQANLTVDGQWSHPLSPGATVLVEKAEKPLLIYRTEDSFFRILRKKLRWGERAP